MMQNPQTFNQMMSNNPQFTNSWMNNMMSNPQMMNTWTNAMLQNPQFMNQWMTSMMQNPEFLQQYMGSWMMFQNPQFMQRMMSLLAVQQNQTVNYAHNVVKTNKVSIVTEAWKIATVESYSPTIIQISPNTVVTWKNNDNVVHTVTDLGGKFDSHLILPDANWQYTFYDEGKYNYFCTLHPWMKGLVIVS
jgi:plastocyanin